ncbi:MAG TPA: SDR family NAD(P)-dependent oxidoreductase, partial [Vicinamibacteria bacterium]
MGQELYQTQPTFRRALDRCQQILGGRLEKPLLSALDPPAGEGSPLEDTAWAQPALFSLEYALAELWRSWGVEPSAVLGHSVGEYAAACVAGVLSLEDALGLIAARGRLMQSLPAGGAMAAIFAPEDAVRAALPAGAAVAAVNGPDNVVVSGPEGAVRAVREAFEARGVRTQALKAAHAFHSALMDPVLDALEQAASPLRFTPPRIPLVSNLTGRPLGDDPVDARYWRRHAREAVRFDAGITALLELGCRVFVEVGPAPTLLGIARRRVGDEGFSWLPSLREGRSDWSQLLESVGALYRRGLAVDWTGFDRDYPRRKVALPTYPFERERYWVEARPTAPAPARARRHPLLGERTAAGAHEARFDAAFDPARQGWLADHRIHGGVLVPATAYLEVALAAAAEVLGPGACAVRDVVLSEPLAVPAGGRRDARVTVTRDAGGAAAVQVASLDPDGGEPEGVRVHASCALAPEAGDRPAGEALAALRARCATPLAVDEYYGTLSRAGLDFGPAFRGLTALWRGDGEALAQVRRPADAGAYRLHPALLDACLQPLGALREGAGAGAEGQTCLPVALDALWSLAPAEGDVWSHVRVRAPAGAATIVADVRVYGEDGALLAALDGLRLVAASPDLLRQAVEADAEDALYEITWSEAPLAASPATRAPGAWLLIADASGVAEALARRLATEGARLVTVPAGEATRREALEAALASLLDTPLAGVIHLGALGDATDGSVESLRAVAEAACAGLLHVLQALVDARAGDPAPVLVVTRGSQPVPGTEMTPAAVAQATALGLLRTAALEHPEVPLAAVDLDPAATVDEAAAVVAEELAAGVGAGVEAAHRAGRRHVRRLARRSARALRDERPAVELEIARPGILDELRVVEASRRPPARGEVEIEVHAAGVNFRDVLKALGAYQGPAGPAGTECAGRIVAVGPGVEAFAVGDEVLAVSPGAFRSHVTCAAALVLRRPDALTVEQAAATPVAFLTAVYALDRLARLRAGERVLIHAAAGGVGLAAVQVARRAGAEVLATAGSEEKRAFLRGLGVRHVMDSRSLAFADEVRALTSGEGVDVVLNSLTGEAIPASLRALRAGGRFLEIGKAGIWTAPQVAAARADVAYFPIYLGDLEPDALHAMLRETVDALVSGALQPLPVRTFALRDAPAAFRFMAQAKHIGKVVLRPERAAAVRADATYLVTGGLGSLGRAVARWLVARGARHLVLAGRRAGAEEAAGFLRELSADGASVVAAPVDVADAGAVTALVARIQAEMPPLRGVVHAAGVLDDGVLRQQSWARFQRVLEPKLPGAWNLHQATAVVPLDFFVLFSSAAALFGAPGQGNYAAANAALDALAHYRRTLGLPALSLDWGPWDEVGMAAALGAREKERWARQGVGLLAPSRALALMERLLSGAAAQVGVMAARKRTARPAPAEAAAAEPAERPALLRELDNVPAAKRAAAVLAHVRRELLAVLGLDAARAPEPQQGFRDVGMDSLMS